jgi:hypothetical protein
MNSAYFRQGKQRDSEKLTQRGKAERKTTLKENPD